MPKPTKTNNGAIRTAAALLVDENTTSVTTAVGDDPQSAPVSYAIVGGAGNDRLFGDTGSFYTRLRDVTQVFGSDTYVFEDGSGHDTIRDFQQGLDTLQVDGYGLSDFSQPSITSSGGNSTVHFDATNSVVVFGAVAMDLNDFDFV